jgi:drug/metabolite transporter (DMT)-like permease
MGVCVKALGGKVGPIETIFFRGLGSSLLGLLAHAALRRPIRTGSQLVLALRILTGALSLFCYYGAIEGVREGPGALATAQLLLKTAPVWVALGAGLLLGEPVGRHTWFAVALGIAGAAIVFLGPRQGGAGTHETVVLGLLSGIFAAGAYLAVRKLALADDPLSVVTLFSLGLVVVTGPIVAFRWRPLPDARSALLLFGVAGCGTVAQWFMTYAYKNGRAALVAVVGLAEVAFAVAAGVFFFGERPSWTTFLGGGLAITAGLVATLRAGAPSLPRAKTSR